MTNIYICYIIIIITIGGGGRREMEVVFFFVLFWFGLGCFVLFCFEKRGKTMAILSTVFELVQVIPCQLFSQGSPVI